MWLKIGYLEIESVSHVAKPRIDLSVVGNFEKQLFEIGSTMLP